MYCSCFAEASAVKRRHHRVRHSLAGLAALGTVTVFLATVTVSAQNLEISWSTMDCGGGSAEAATLKIWDTVGQVDAEILQGGAFTFQGGFWSAFTPAGCDVDLDGDCDAGDLSWIVTCHADGSGCTCPGDPDLTRDGLVDGRDSQVILFSAFGRP